MNNLAQKLKIFFGALQIWTSLKNENHQYYVQLFQRKQHLLF
jgi:hypothetical protein